MVPDGIGQLFYTSADTPRGRGYQFVAESPGISEEVKKKVQVHSAPSSYIPADYDFKEATVLFRVAGGMTAVMRMVNVGVGFDGRPNTIYTHTLLLSPGTFKLLDYHFLSLEPMFRVEPELRGKVDGAVLSATPVDVLQGSSLDALRERAGDRVVLAKVFESLQVNETTVVQLDVDEDPRDLVEVVVGALPAEVRSGMGLSTLDTGLSKNKDLDLVVVPSAIRGLQAADGVGVVDLSTGRSNVDSAGPYSEFLATNLLDGETRPIEEFNAFASDYPVSRDSVSRLFSCWQLMERLPEVSDELERAELHTKLSDCMRPFSPDEALRNLERALMLSQRTQSPQHVAKLLEGYLGMCGETGEEERAASMYQRVVNRYLNTGRPDALSEFIGSFPLPAGRMAIELGRTLVDETRSFIETAGLSSGDANKLDIATLRGLEPLIEDGEVRSDYLAICDEGLAGGTVSPDGERALLRAKAKALPYLQPQERQRESGPLIERLERMGLHQDVIEVQLELVRHDIIGTDSESYEGIDALLPRLGGDGAPGGGQFREVVDLMGKHRRSGAIVHHIQDYIGRFPDLPTTEVQWLYGQYSSHAAAIGEDLAAIGRLGVCRGYGTFMIKLVLEGPHRIADKAARKQVSKDIENRLEGMVALLSRAQGWEAAHMSVLTELLDVFALSFGDLPKGLSKLAIDVGRRLSKGSRAQDLETLRGHLAELRASCPSGSGAVKRIDAIMGKLERLSGGQPHAGRA